MCSTKRTADSEADIRLLIEAHETIVGILRTPRFAYVLGQLDHPQVRSRLKTNPAAFAAEHNIQLPAGARIVVEGEADDWRVEVHVPIQGLNFVFGVDSHTGYFDEFRAV